MITVNNRDKIDFRENYTISDLFKDMKFDYSLITVYVDGKYVPDEDYPTFILHDGASVQAIHIMHGG
jgi:thiamine biosynthesis protein ThiS